MKKPYILWFAIIINGRIFMKNVIVGKESLICEDAKCYILEYYVLANESDDATDLYPMYGFEVKKKEKDKEIESFKLEEFTTNKDEIHNLVSMLKNNIVTPITVFDVIQDIKSA